MTATAEKTEVFEEITEQLEEEKRCEAVPRCLSLHRRPAVWFWSHEGAGDSCSLLICDPCKRNAERVIHKADRENGGIVGCRLCHSRFPTSQIITRLI